MQFASKIAAGLLALTLQQAAVGAASLPSLSELKTMQAAFAPVTMRVDLSGLPENEQQALAHILAAAQIMDALFLRQVWAGNESTLLSLLQDQTPLGRERLKLFVLYKGPWNRLEDNSPFLPGVGAKPKEGNFYPVGSSKSEIEKWMAALGPAEKTAAQSFFSVIRRGTGGQLHSVGYEVAYQPELTLAAKHLDEAAAATQQATLKDFLSKRAQAFRSNDYYESEIAWMKLDASIEPTLGPYEVYEDEWFNAKAAFEAFVTIRDEAETKRLGVYAAELQELENHLPIIPAYRNPKLGALAPIKVVNSLYSAGDASHGVQTAAYNLPNDERVAAEMGSKRTMLKNIQSAKFQTILLPIATKVLSTADQKLVNFDAFFTHILMHEIMHGLGPHSVHDAPEATTVRSALQDTYSAIEEAKADISGLWAMQQLIDKGVIDAKLEKSMYVTFLASAFRSIRFGLSEAHGKGIALQLNSLLDAGAFTVDARGLFAVDSNKIKNAVAQLTGDLMNLQAEGSYKKADELLRKQGIIRPAVKRALDRLKNTPVDIAPRYVTAEELMIKFSPSL